MAGLKEPAGKHRTSPEFGRLNDPVSDLAMRLSRSLADLLTRSVGLTKIAFAY
jgi:hypothetical protein